jgi:hypothetical protein
VAGANGLGLKAFSQPALVLDCSGITAKGATLSLLTSTAERSGIALRSNISMLILMPA